MEFIGRFAALAELVALGAATEHSAIVVTGEVGLGRSRLLEETRRACPNAVLIRVNPAERALPLAGLSMILTSLGDGRLAEFTTRFATEPATDENLFAVAGGLLSLLRSIALPPTLVLLDDVDLMDRESRVILGFVCTRLTSTGLSMVFSKRALTPGSPFSGLPSIALRPLSGADARAMVESRASETRVDRGTLQLIAEAAQGLPLVVREIVDSLTQAQLRGQEALVLPFRSGARLNAIAEQRLAGLTAAQIDVVTMLSSAAATDIGIMTRDAPETADTLEDLITVGIVTVSGRYAHLTDRLLRSSVYWGQAARSRRVLHASLAEQYAEHDTRLAAWHDSWAQPVSSRADDLLWAASSWADEGHYAIALEFAERWLSVQQGEHHVDAAVVSFVKALIRHGDVGLARRYARFDQTRAADSAVSVELAELSMICSFLLDERIPDEIPVDTMTISPSPAERSDLMFALSALQAERGDLSQSERSLAAAHHVQRAAGTVVLAGDSIDSTLRQRRYWCAALTVAQRPRGPAQHRTEIMREPDALLASPATQVVAARALTFGERYGEARRLFRVALAHADPDDLTIAGVALTLAIENEILAGHFDQADTLIDQLETTGEVLRLRCVMLRAWSSQMHGQRAVADELLGEAQSIVDHRRDSILTARLHHLRGSGALMAGDAVSAARHLLRVDELTQTLSFVRHSRYVGDLVESLAETGAVEEARQVLSRFTERRLHTPTRWSALIAARSAAILSPDEDAVSMFDRAVAVFSDSDSPFELARTLRAYGSRLDSLAGEGRGSAQHAAASRLFAGIGALAWVPPPTRVSVLAGFSDQPAPAPGGAGGMLARLTENELAIVRLVQSGYRNKEIAAQLFLSLRTVEVRLTQIYRKTGARSRAFLLAMLMHESAGQGPDLRTPTGAERTRSGPRGADLSGAA